MATVGKEPFSLYFHIPFCKKKCPYCHFFVLKEEEKKKDLLLAAFFKEWDLLAMESYGPLVSIYLGGGTPSLMGAERLGRLLEWIRVKKGPFLTNPEITLEVNPDEVTLEKAQAFKAVGINRISLGVQSLNDRALTTLARTHSADTALRAIDHFHAAGFDNVSIDLMYDRPYQTLEEWKTELSLLSKLPISHVSLYNLTIEEGSAYKRQEAKIRSVQPEPELSKALLDHALSALEEAGFKRYEISAFAKEKKPSIHNLGYWQGRDFYGLGPSAFSYIQGRRYQNKANFPQYIADLQAEKCPIGFEETLSYGASLNERLAIGLRVLEGISIEAFQAKWGHFSSQVQKNLQGLIDEGYLQKQDLQLQLTPKGQLFYDEVGIRLI